MKTKSEKRGFTLIELMVTVAVIAILAAIAYPSYLSYLKKGRRASAQTFMMDIANKESQYLLDARNYAVTGDDTAIATIGLTIPSDVSPYYDLKVCPAATTTPPTFTVVANPKGDQATDPYGAMSVDQSGAKKRNVDYGACGTGGTSGW